MKNNIVTSFDKQIQKEDGVVLTMDTNSKELLPKHKWSELNFNELIEQKNLIYDKWEFLINGNNKQLASDFAQFLIDIDLFIHSKL